jgi:hypothetical protein
MPEQSQRPALSYIDMPSQSFKESLFFVDIEWRAPPLSYEISRTILRKNLSTIFP